MAKKSSSIGKYRIVEELASSTSSRVLLAEDTSTKNRVVAIKQFHAIHLGSLQERNAFLQEAQLLTTLKHPYILPVLEAGIDKDVPYLVMEYVFHGSLHDRLRKQSPRLLNGQEALGILAQVGQALHYAHQQNMLHRKLKPANIFFNANGDALLADFGIITIAQAGNKDGAPIGTANYMAPEQFRGSTSEESDQYALGCIAYELFTGRVPFTSRDFVAVGLMHMSETPIPPTQLNLLVPRSLEQVLFKAMAKQRAERYANIAAFLAALGVPPTVPEYARTTPATSLPASVPSPLPAPPAPLAIIKATKISDRSGKSNGPAAFTPGSERVDREQPGGPLSPAASLPHVFEDVPWRPQAEYGGLPASADLPDADIVKHSKKSWSVQHWRLVAATIPLILLLILGSAFYAVSNIFSKPRVATASTATVTITPASKAVSSIFTISAVTGNPNARLQQVHARLLSFTLLQSETVLATGEGTATPVQARGTLTFFNDSTSPQPFSAGKIYTGRDGVQVINDVGGIIPAGNPNTNLITWKSIKVPAHAILTGQAGNIKQGDVNIWTANGPKSSFVVENKGAFSGGQDAVYTFVQPGDLNNATNPLEAMMFRDVQTILQAQVQPNEERTGSTHCTSHVAYNHPPESRVASVTASITVTCTWEVYDQQAAQAMATKLLSQKIAGSSISTNKITATVVQVNVDREGIVSLFVQATSSPFSDAQRQAFAKLIAGKSEQAAKTILRKQTGIKQVLIKNSGGDGQTLPTNPAQITITVLS